VLKKGNSPGRLDPKTDIETCFEHVDRLRELKAERPDDYRAEIGYLLQVASGEVRSKYPDLTAEMAETLLWELDEGDSLVTEISRAELVDLLNGIEPQPALISDSNLEDQYMGGDDRFVPMEETDFEVEPEED